MKFAVVLLFASLFTAGCHAQPSPTPPVASCGPLGSYTQLNPVGSTTNPPATATTYVDTPSGPSCYVVTGSLPASGSAPVQYAAPSNVVGPIAGGATGKVDLSWTCQAGAGQTCTGVVWVVSRQAAITALAPAVPTVNAPTTSEVAKPEKGPQIALNVKLKGGL